MNRLKQTITQTIVVSPDCSADGQSYECTATINDMRISLNISKAEIERFIQEQCANLLYEKIQAMYAPMQEETPQTTPSNNNNSSEDDPIERLQRERKARERAEMERATQQNASCATPCDSKLSHNPKIAFASKSDFESDPKTPPQPPKQHTEGREEIIIGAKGERIPINWEKFIKYWNTEVGDYVGKIINVKGSRKLLANARLKEYGKDAFITVIKNIATSDFLRGDNKHAWHATFDWVIRPNNFRKVLERNYNKTEYEQQNGVHLNGRQYDPFPNLRRGINEYFETGDSPTLRAMFPEKKYNPLLPDA